MTRELPVALQSFTVLASPPDCLDIAVLPQRAWRAGNDRAASIQQTQVTGTTHSVFASLLMLAPPATPQIFWP